MGIPVSFVRPDGDRCAIVVNFGVVTGREATQAEVDRLGRRLLESRERVTVTACRRHDLDEGGESVVHQVVVEEVDPDEAERLLEVCEAWTADCAAERTLEPLDG